MHRVLIGVVVSGALIIAGIGFTGSYAAVRELAIKKGFGNFSYVFPVGIDAGICVLLALDLLLTWIRIPFPLLRQTAWLLTAATIAFNGAAAWPDPLGVGMHAVIPILFVVAVEAARHAIGRIADITADKHMEGVRLTRWLLSPVPTFLLWRRMKLWELRSYEQVIKLEQERLVYQARLRSRFGRAWRRKAPVESLMPLRLARYGVPLAETAPAGLAAAGIEPLLLPAAQQPQLAPASDPAIAAASDPAIAAAGSRAAGAAPVPQRAAPPGGQHPEIPVDEQSPWFQAQLQAEYHGGYDPTFEPAPDPQYVPEEGYEPWYEEQPPEQFQQPSSSEETGSFPIPVGPNRTRELGDGGGPPEPGEDAYYQIFRESIKSGNGAPTPRGFIADVEATYGITLPEAESKRMVNRFSNRLNAELADEHIA
ncbi:membrane protein [Streptomyces roseochromogenus subsp. oscitans DS 12.976]|uniref:Membrane protein n=2 Tax=Streptomyces roseochromogenus TaxID=285450 RepID=V6KF72_STRRC|nr:membrane protein [Streptomyces roseochromogenus subsp. oscitans DS 12.976]